MSRLEPSTSSQKQLAVDVTSAHAETHKPIGEMTHSPPPIEPLQTCGEVNEEEEKPKEKNDGDEDLKAPVELIIKFFRAVMDRDLQLASRLCQMILIYEPENPEASEFLPLIQKKLLEEKETEQSNNEDEDDEDDDDDHSESDKESSPSSSCSSSSSSSPSDDDDDDEEKEKQVNRHKLCPPSHDSP